MLEAMQLTSGGASPLNSSTHASLTPTGLRWGSTSMYLQGQDLAKGPFLPGFPMRPGTAGKLNNGPCGFRDFQAPGIDLKGLAVRPPDSNCDRHPPCLLPRMWRSKCALQPPFNPTVPNLQAGRALGEHPVQTVPGAPTSPTGCQLSGQPMHRSSRYKLLSTPGKDHPIMEQPRGEDDLGPTWSPGTSNKSLPLSEAHL